MVFELSSAKSHRSRSSFMEICGYLAVVILFLTTFQIECQNFLICPATHRITGLLDEFARIGTSPEELLDGLGDFRQHTCVEPAPEGLNIHLFEGKGWPCLATEPASLGCQTARAWRNIYEPPARYAETAKVSAFLEGLCPCAISPIL